MLPWGYLRDLPRPMWTLAAATLINRMGVMAMPFLVLYLTQVLAFSEEFIELFTAYDHETFGQTEAAIAQRLGWRSAGSALGAA